ncbi:5671_t:CDS:2 [Diversispora eburnea]|uniref:5671_t:CDS:1 n=1 Tax=Diversispora eburnea TaxID=1213867 RepID=A0A9N8YLW1_9GLOM|nr:5671_t:CDS:2 [Diversispora eburnea]
MTNNPISESTSVKVVLRIRPLTAEDLIKLPSRFQKNILSLSPFSPNQVTVQAEKKLNFTFDHVFGTETAQKEIYEHSIKDVVDKFLEGFNVTILAYGQTSSGKTHTMGTSDNLSLPAESRGIIPRSLETLFTYINSAQYKNRKYVMKVSFVEIYNEDLIDLLAEGDEENRPQVTIREGAKGNIIWSGLQEIKVNSVEEVMSHLVHGSLNRQVGATEMNAKSSRSHAIFSVTLSQQRPANNSGPISPTAMSPTPPPSRAGSRMSKRIDDGEWLKRTSAIGERAKEGISINSGLLALGNVISALGDPTKTKSITHVPYRDSKLTRLLQDSLGGNAQTLMIACVSPAEYNVSETVNTLKYANRARNIKNIATVNQEEAGWHDLEHLQHLVLKLRAEIKALKHATGIITNSGRNTPSEFGNSRRSSTPLSIITSGLSSPTTQIHLNKDKDIDALEEQLAELQRSYSELSQKYAKTSAELSMYQDNTDLLPNYDEKAVFVETFQETIGPVISEYEKSIAELENQLKIARASLPHSEKLMQDQGLRLEEAEELNIKNKDVVLDLKNKIAKLIETEEISKNYIKDLEVKLDSHSVDQKKDQETIEELRNKITKLRSNSEKNEGVIQKLELRLAKSENKVAIMNETTQNLEKALHEREDAYQKLETKYKNEKSLDEEDQTLLMSQIEDRDRRIAELEKKVDELVTEIAHMKKLKVDVSGSLMLTNDFSTVLNLESKLTELQKTHEKTVSEFTEVKEKYQSCLGEITELHSQLDKVKIPQFGITIDESIPTTPLNNNINNEIQDVNSLMVHINSSHRKAKSLSDEIQGAEKRELSSMAMVQKLQIELKQLESLHSEKAEGLKIVQQEFARLEQNHRETLEIVDELREELQKRDALAQIEVMSVMTSEYSYAESGYSAATSEIDQLEIVHRLREEVEQLKEEQKKNLEIIGQYQNEKENENNIEFEVRDISQNDELVERQQRADKLQSEIESKSHTIAALLFPSVEQQDAIRKLEEELQETKEAYHLATEEKNSKLNTISEDEEIDLNVADKQVEALEEKIKLVEAQLAKEKEAAQKQQHVSNPRNSYINLIDPTHKTIEALEEKFKSLQEELAIKSETIESLKGEHELVVSLHGQLEALKLDVRHKYELIEILKRDLADKSILQQRLREKEAEALAFRTKLMEVHKQEEDLENEIKKLKARLYKLENGEDVNKVLQAELNALRNELKDVKARESVASERLRVLKSRLDSDREESHLQEQLEHLRIVEIAQRERIAVLENRLFEKGGKVEENIVKLQTDLAIARETEIVQKRTIENLEIKLKKADERSQATNLKRELAVLKIKEEEQNKKVQELEIQLSESSNKDSEKIIQLKEEIERLHSHEREQRKQIETLENRLELAVKDEDPSISVLRDQIAGLKASETDLRRTVQELESKFASAQKEAKIFETVKEEVAFLKELETDQKSTIEQLQSQLRKIRNSKEAAVKELQTMKGGFSIQKELVISLEDELKTLRQELASAKENTNVSSTELEELSTLLSNTQKQRDEAQRHAKTLEIEVETYKLAGVAGNENIGALQEELINTKLELVAQNEIIVELESEMIIVEKERDNKNQRVTELMEALEKREANQKDAVKGLESTLMNLETELVMAKGTSKMNKDTIEILEEKLSFVRLQLKEAKASDERRTNMINELESKLQETLSALTERENGISNQDNFVFELETLIQNTQFELQSTKVSESEAVARIKELEAKLADASKLEFNSTTEELRASKDELNKVKASEAKFIQQAQNLEKKLHDIQERHDQEIIKLQQANEEICTLSEKCYRLQTEIDDAHHDSVIQCYENIDDDMVEYLNNELRKAHNQVQVQRDYAEELEKIAKQLELEKKTQTQRNEDLEAEVDQLQKDLETLADEFNEAASKFADADELSRQQKIKIVELEKALEEVKKSSSGGIDQRVSESTNPALAKLAVANEKLRQTNNDLNFKITEAEDKTRVLNDKIKLLENEISRLNARESESVKQLKDKIKELEVEKDSLEEANESFFEERGKLDQKIEFLMQQLQSMATGKPETQIAELNERIIKLEKELFKLKQDSLAESKEMEKEIAKLLEVNDQLELEIKEIYEANKHKHASLASISSMTSNNRGSTGSINSVSSREQTKLARQESTITKQSIMIKSLQEKISELEKRSSGSIETEIQSGARNSTSSILSSASDLRKNSVRSIAGNSTVNNVNAELASEIQKLQKKIAKMEGESTHNRQLVETLENTLSDNETNLRVAKKQLTALQKEKHDFVEQIKALRIQLDDAQEQVEQTRSVVQEEKKVMESVLEEERKAKEKAEKARSAMERQMEQLIAKKSKFMCF